MGNNNTHCCNFYCTPTEYVDFSTTMTLIANRLRVVTPDASCDTQYELGDCTGSSSSVSATLEITCPSGWNKTLEDTHGVFEINLSTATCEFEYEGSLTGGTCCGDVPTTFHDCGDDCTSEVIEFCTSNQTGKTYEYDMNWYDMFMLKADTKYYTAGANYGCNEWRGALKKIILRNVNNGAEIDWYFDGLSTGAANRRYTASVGTPTMATVSDMVDNFEINNYKGLYTTDVTNGGDLVSDIQFGDGVSEYDLLNDGVQVKYQKYYEYKRTMGIRIEPAECGGLGGCAEPEIDLCVPDECYWGSCHYASEPESITTEGENGLRRAWLTITVDKSVDIATLDGKSFSLSDGTTTTAFTFDASTACNATSGATIGISNYAGEEDIRLAGYVAASISDSIADEGWTVFASGGYGCGIIPANKDGDVQIFVLQQVQGTGTAKNQSSGNVLVDADIDGLNFDGFSDGSDAVYDPCTIGTGWSNTSCNVPYGHGGTLSSTDFSWS